MAVERVFLGYDGPCLPRAAQWLRERYGGAPACDMSGVTVVMPGSRAGRRLLELLTEPGGALAPSRIITAGSLPELLYESASPVADGLTALLARLAALRQSDRALLEPLVPQPPDDNDLVGWLALARELDKLGEDLSGEQVTIADVIAHGQKQVEFTEEARWEAIAQLQRSYETLLRERGLIDRHAARFDAIRSRACRSEGDIVLLAAADLPRTTRAMLHQVSDHVVALIHAPREEKDAFDELGCVVPQQWCERAIDVPESIIHITDRPRDQAMAALELIGGLGAEHAADQITIGVGDERMTPLLLRTLDLAGLSAHAPVGRPVSQSRPATLLAALAEFISRQRLDDFASLLRHPDLDAWLAREHAPDASAAEHWLTLLDNYINEHLLALSVGEWLGDEAQAARLKRVHEAVIDLVAAAVRLHISEAANARGPQSGPFASRPLPQWSPVIAAILESVYGKLELDPREPADADLVRAIEAIAAALREQALISGDDHLAPRLALPDAIRLTLARLADAETPVASEPAGPAIELLGWLELQLDDAPALVITGFNEHHIPQSGSSGADAFLPDRLRGSLGLMDSRRRYARDAAAFTAILRSRPHVALIAGRRGHDDEPLKPSRLLLTGAGEALAERVLRFYPKDPAHSDAPPHHRLLPVGTSRFVIPAPRPRDKPLDSLHVTAFRTYLDCPYRFYLRHIENLAGLSDAVVELDALHFGNLAHDVMRDFAQSKLRDCEDAEAIREFVRDRLDTLARSRYGSHPPVPVAVQLVQLRDRLGALAAWQAMQPRQGWRIVPEHIEVKAQATLEIDGATFTIHGRIDRIDRHESGAHRIIDYKSGDRGDVPEKTHRSGPKGAKEWIDLQLPLYHKLAAGLGITGVIELGYIVLPKKLDSVGYERAEWTEDDLRSAFEKAEEVIRAVRAGRFWPPRDIGGYEDEFTAICIESYRGRDEVIRAVSETIARATAVKRDPD